MNHTGGASGNSPELNALLAVNRVRYIRMYHSAKAVLDVERVVSCPPRTPKDQLAVLHRVYRGNAEQNDRHGTASQTLSEVVRSIRGPLSAVHASVYMGCALAGRRGAAHPAGWERDASSRQPGAGGNFHRANNTEERRGTLGNTEESPARR